MSLIGMPSTRKYWGSTCYITQVADVISLHRWENIKRNLHFTNNSQIPGGNTDQLIKLRELFEQIRGKLNKTLKELCLLVDEQVIPFKGIRSLKKYNPKKPKKWGYKMFCLAGASGIAYDLEFYVGQTDHPAHLPSVGASGNVVI